MEPYKSPYEAYPFLADDPKDYRCDFELLTDSAASEVGLLRAMVTGPALQQELQTMNELTYHANPTLRTRLSLTQAEINWLAGRVAFWEQEVGQTKEFVLPQGCQAACMAHTLRVRGKEIVRLLHRHAATGHNVPPLLFDYFHLFSGYFFMLALWLNKQQGIAETPFASRNYQ